MHSAILLFKTTLSLGNKKASFSFSINYSMPLFLRQRNNGFCIIRIIPKIKFRSQYLYQQTIRFHKKWNFFISFNFKIPFSYQFYFLFPTPNPCEYVIRDPAFNHTNVPSGKVNFVLEPRGASTMISENTSFILIPPLQ